MTRFAIALALGWLCGAAWAVAPKIDRTLAQPTRVLTISPAKAQPKTESTAPNLIASLVCPTKQEAGFANIQFSPAGDQLFTGWYPCGVMQIWDVATKKEIRRIATPPGFECAMLSADWKRLYFPVLERSVEMNGMVVRQLGKVGRIRTWDVATGKEQEPLSPEAGSAPIAVELDPSGRFMVCVEEAPSGFSQSLGPRYITVAWELATGKKCTLCGASAMPLFFPDGKTVAVEINDWESNTVILKLIDLATGKEQAEVRLKAMAPDCQIYLDQVAPDGTVIEVDVCEKDVPQEVWFLDGRTLEERGKLVSAANAKPRRAGYGAGVFSPDGKCYITLDPAGQVWIWDLAARKVERTISIGSNMCISETALSPDGKTLAVGWTPEFPEDFDKTQNDVSSPDFFLDLPRPRVSLIALDGSAPPRVLIAPRGRARSIAFSPDGKTLAFEGYGAVHLFDLTK